MHMMNKLASLIIAVVWYTVCAIIGMKLRKINNIRLSEGKDSTNASLYFTWAGILGFNIILAISIISHLLNREM